jgi:cysteine desulfurase
LRAYLDHASTSLLRPEARAALSQWLSAADPGRVHTEGRMARAALEEARARVAELFGTRPRQVIFTSGATESINAATYGALALRPSGPGPVVLAAVEHSAVREASDKWSPELIHVGVDGAGAVSVAEVADVLSRRPDIGLVHCQLANHEVGTRQPVAEVAALCRSAGVLVHVDAAAAAGHVDLAFDRMGVDLLSVSAHKMGGPAGVGALLVRRGLRVPPLIVGGAQERARRAGLENVAGAAGFGAMAAVLTDSESPESGLSGGGLTGAGPGRSGLTVEAERAAGQVARLRAALATVPGVTFYGPADPAQALPHLLCLGVDGVEAEPVLIGLDRAGVAAHSGSSCSSELLEPSPVLEAMGVDGERSLRLSVGWSTTDEEVDLVARVFPRVVEDLRRLRAGGPGPDVS